MRGDLQIIHIF